MSLNIPSTAARLHVRRQSLRGVPLVRVRSLRSSGARAPPPASKFAALDKLDVLGDGPQNTRRVVIDAVGPDSFTVNGLRISGSVFLFPHFATIWNVASRTELCPAAFVLPKLLLPRPDLVVLGMGRSSQPLDLELKRFFSDLRISVDAMDTTNACHTFNVLNQEGRNVAAAMLPESAE